MNKKPILRMCVVSKKHFPKDQLLRIVLKPNKQDIVIDWNQNFLGRGLYLQNNQEIIQEFLNKKIINKVFKRKFNDEEYETLKQELLSIKIN